MGAHHAEDVRAGKCERELLEAERDGRVEDENWRVFQLLGPLRNIHIENNTGLEGHSTTIFDGTSAESLMRVDLPYIRDGTYYPAPRC